MHTGAVSHDQTGRFAKEMTTGGSPKFMPGREESSGVPEPQTSQRV